MMAEFTVWI